MMTPDKMIAIIQAYKEGKTIEMKDNTNESPSWYVIKYDTFDFVHCDYRIAEEPKEISLYEEITFLNDFVHSDNMEMSELQKDMLRDVVNYADGCYVNHCEEVGKIAIENIKEMKQNWLETAQDWFNDNAWSFSHSHDGEWAYDTAEAFDCFKKYMEKNG